MAQRRAARLDPPSGEHRTAPDRDDTRILIAPVRASLRAAARSAAGDELVSAPMLDPHREIQALVDNFVADLSELAKRIAIEQVKTAFSTGAKFVAPVITAPERSTRARRGQHEIDALRSKLVAAIMEQPGRRTEDLNAVLGTRTAQIAQLLRRLVADRVVRTEGARRGTRYFAATPPEVQNGRRPPADGAAALEESAS
jgi:hypothetical protein